jgi:hypothetical protein
LLDVSLQPYVLKGTLMKFKVMWYAECRIYGSNISLWYEQILLAIRGGPYMTLIAGPDCAGEILLAG